MIYFYGKIQWLFRASGLYGLYGPTWNVKAMNLIMRYININTGLKRNSILFYLNSLISDSKKALFQDHQRRQQ